MNYGDYHVQNKSRIKISFDFYGPRTDYIFHGDWINITLDSQQFESEYYRIKQM